jgi:hypothetical protein
MYPMLRSRTFALVLAIAMLVLPATSLAQSAGDDQYNDPLSGQNSHSGGGHSGGGHSGGSKGSTGTSGSGTAATPAPAASTPSATGAAPQASAGSRKQLPRTGFDVILTVEIGLALLLAGVTWQRTLVLRERRR